MAKAIYIAIMGDRRDNAVSDTVNRVFDSNGGDSAPYIQMYRALARRLGFVPFQWLEVTGSWEYRVNACRGRERRIPLSDEVFYSMEGAATGAEKILNCGVYRFNGGMLQRRCARQTEAGSPGNI